MRNAAVLIAVLTVLLAVRAATADAIPVDRAPLATIGVSYEVNRDTAGNVYVTDWGAGEVWRVGEATGAYTRYAGLGSPRDARPDAAGDIWLTDFRSPLLTRINTSANPVTRTTWDLSAWQPGRTYKLLGTALDGAGKVWFTEWGEVSDTQLLYRFDPTTKQLCGYTLPGGNHSFYLVYRAPYFWLGDAVQGRILRFNTAGATVDYWDIGAKAEPHGLALDPSGNLWWADLGTRDLGKLEPATNTVTLVALPDASPPNTATPYMVSWRDDKLWYAAKGDELGTLGNLDPARVTGQPSTAKTGSFTSAETCNSLGTGTTSNLATSTGMLAWTSDPWVDVTPAGATGWTVYEAPTTEMPYGILAGPLQVWIVDQYNNRLLAASLALPEPVVRISAGVPAKADVQLQWDSVAGASAYRVWKGDAPYFQPDPTPDQDSAATSYTDPIALAAAGSTYYVVRVVSATGGVESQNSNRTGRFTFAVTAGNP